MSSTAISSAEPAKPLSVRMTTWFCGAWKRKHDSPPKGCPLNGDVFVGIADCLTDTKDILNMCLTSKYMLSVLLRSLYSNVELKGINRCRSTLTTLAEHPDICRYVQKLVLRPSWIKAPSKQGTQDETWVASMIENLAANFPGLHTFEWDGLETPIDHMWLTLRTHCPRLKNIGSSVGTVDLIPDSHLFDFRDLVSFSLVVKWRERSMSERRRKRLEQLPKPLWRMLLKHSPNLETLAFATTPAAPRFYDVRPVMSGRWPRLRNLTLGETFMENEDSSFGHRSSPVMNFLLDHPNLRNLSLPGRRYSINPQNRLTHEGFLMPLVRMPYSMLRLESFSGSVFVVMRELRHLRMLKHLSLMCEDHDSYHLPKLYAMLKLLPSLVTLKIWIDLSYSDPSKEETDHARVFHSILTACPKLQQFDLICSTESKLTFSFKDLSYALRDSPQLKKLSVTKVYKSSDEDMVQGTARIVRDNPNLERVEVKTAQGSWSYVGAMSLRKWGKYDVVHDDRGSALGMQADEWGLGLMSRVSRRYKYSLLPTKAQVAEKIGDLGLLRRT